MSTYLDITINTQLSESITHPKLKHFLMKSKTFTLNQNHDSGQSKKHKSQNLKNALSKNNFLIELQTARFFQAFPFACIVAKSLSMTLAKSYFSRKVLAREKYFMFMSRRSKIGNFNYAFNKISIFATT